MADAATFLAGLEWWHWLLAALVLGSLELFLPGAIFIWFAAAAGLVGVATFFVPGIPWQAQVIGFGLLSFVAIAAWREWRRRHPERTDQPTLNRRGEQYVGKVLDVVDPIENGYGKAKLGDTVWTVKGPDVPVGTRVRVTGTDNTVLVVEPVD